MLFYCVATVILMSVVTIQNDESEVILKLIFMFVERQDLANKLIA